MELDKSQQAGICFERYVISLNISLNINFIS